MGGSRELRFAQRPAGGLYCFFITWVVEVFGVHPRHLVAVLLSAVVMYLIITTYLSSARCGYLLGPLVINLTILS